VVGLAKQAGIGAVQALGLQQAKVCQVLSLVFGAGAAGAAGNQAIPEKHKGLLSFFLGWTQKNW